MIVKVSSKDFNNKRRSAVDCVQASQAHNSLYNTP